MLKTVKNPEFGMLFKYKVRMLGRTGTEDRAEGKIFWKKWG
jgi:hypothetical protein